MLSKEYNPEVLKLPSWVTLIVDTVWLLSLQALDVRTKFFMSDAPSRPVRTNVSCAAHSDGASPDVSRPASLLVPPPPRVTICRAAPHRRPWKRSLSNGSFQLHHGRHRRPPWRFAPIRLGTPAADWRLGTSRGGSAHVALTPRKLPPALDAPTQELTSSWWSATRSRRRRGGARSCQSADVGRRHYACRGKGARSCLVELVVHSM